MELDASILLSTASIFFLGMFMSATSDAHAPGDRIAMLIPQSLATLCTSLLEALHAAFVSQFNLSDSDTYFALLSR